MSKREMVTYTWSRFDKGMVTAIERSQIASEALAEGSNGIYPHKHGYLAPFPKVEDFFDPGVGRNSVTGLNTKCVGSCIWRPQPGREIMVFAVYGDWTIGAIQRTGTLLFHFVNPDDSDDYLGAFGSAEVLSFVRGDAPVRFAQLPMTYLEDTLYHPRSNWLVVATPYDYTQLIEYRESNMAVGNQYLIWLPYMFSDVKVYKTRLIGIDDAVNEIYYSEPYDISTFSHFKIGEAYGPNVGLIEALDSIFVLKPDSVWQFAGDVPAQWSRKTKILSSRGSCFPVPVDNKLGIILCDQQGVCLSSGYPEQMGEISAQFPELKADPDDLVQLYERIKVDTAGQFNNGTHNNTDTENWGTSAARIEVLTIDHPTESTQDSEESPTGYQNITAGNDEWQTFKETTTSYWATGLSVRLEPNAGASEVTVELVEFDGSDPDNPDREEVLFIDTASVPAINWYDFTFDLPIFLYPKDGDDYRYMIRVTAVTLDTRWYLDNLNPYSDGRMSTVAGDDALFKVLGYQYYTTGVWTSPWCDAPDVQRWGALVSRLLFVVDDDEWESKVTLRYRYGQSSNPGTYTAWQDFPGYTGYPSGGALSNDFSALFDQIQIEATLTKVDEIPPFVDFLLITYSAVTSDMVYPAGLTFEERLFLGGINPYKTAVTVRSPSGGYYQDWDAYRMKYLSHFIVWRGQVFAGSTLAGDGRIRRIKLDTESDCSFAEGGISIVTGKRGSEDPRRKQLYRVKLVWHEAEYGSAQGAQVTVYISIDGAEEIRNLTSYSNNITERDIGYGRKEKTAILTFSGSAITHEVGITVNADRLIPFIGMGSFTAEVTLPWFELKEISADLLTWPLTQGIR